MKASFFDSMPFLAKQRFPTGWPVPPRYFEPERGPYTYETCIDQLRLVEDIGFDWASFSEHHYGRSQTPSPIVVASNAAAHLKKITVAMMGPVMPLSNPVRVAEELSMLDNI